MKLFRIEARCNNKDNKGNVCGEFLMGTSDKPNLTAEEIHKRWALLVMSAPLNAPKCPRCEYSTFSDCNSGLDFFIDDGEGEVLPSSEWFKKYD